jgi:hypothetical protein
MQRGMKWLGKNPPPEGGGEPSKKWVKILYPIK